MVLGLRKSKASLSNRNVGITSLVTVRSDRINANGMVEDIREGPPRRKRCDQVEGGG